MKLPKQFIHNITQAWGHTGTVWLESLPTIVRYYSSMWQLNNIQTFDNLSYQYVASAYSDLYSCPVVLKVNISRIDFGREQKALNYYNGACCVKVLTSDNKYNSLLLEALEPGYSLAVLFPAQDQEATAITASVIQKLHTRTIDTHHDYPTINQWLHLIDTFRHKNMSQALLSKTSQLAKRLLSTQDKKYLLHGDLHHENILFSSSRDWLAIDPKGVVGELAYEVGAFIRNPIPQLYDQANKKEIVLNRCIEFAKLLCIDTQRIIDWSYVQAVLAACWNLQDGNQWSGMLTCVEILNEQVSIK